MSAEPSLPLDGPKKKAGEQTVNRRCELPLTRKLKQHNSHEEAPPKKSSRGGGEAPSGRQALAASASAHQANIAEYFEPQIGAWCGMHALNNYTGGPHVDRESCRRAADVVLRCLNQDGEQPAENRGDHLHVHSGFLSIDVINVLGAALLGIHVEGRATSWRDLQSARGDFFTRCILSGSRYRCRNTGTCVRYSR